MNLTLIIPAMCVINILITLCMKQGSWDKWGKWVRKDVIATVFWMTIYIVANVR